jgi:hypothetical protein
MSQTQINGATQIKSSTIPWAAMAAGAIVPTASMVDGALFVKSDGSVAMGAALAMGTNKITGLAAPVAANDAVTKAYVDATVNGFTIHGARVVAVANVSALTGLPTTDGVTLVDGNVQLNTAQTTASQNGPWVVHSSAWTRPTWWAGAAVISEGNYFIIDADGTTNKNTKWFVTNTGNITVDTTSVTFTQDLSGTSYTNGTGLGLAGTTFSVLYGATSTTACVGNDARLPTALGTGVNAALAVNVGSTGAVVVNGGALGIPSSGTLTNASGLPIAGIASLGTGVATALAAATNAGSGLLTLSSGVVGATQFPALTGDVTTAGGALATTINHTAGSGFLKYTDWIANETPGGTVNGVNATFTLANTPQFLQLYLNGVLMEVGAGNDYTVSGATITALLIPATGDKYRAYYSK